MKNLWFNKPGLGPNSFGPIRYLLPYHNLFHTAAVIHDECGYSVGGNENDKNKADYIFLSNMVMVCRNTIQLDFSFLYFTLVQKYGKYFFKYK